jgi:hypothetical protein
MKKTIMILALGLTAAVFVMVGSASAVQVDTETNTSAKTIEKLILEMQKEMIMKNFSARLLKNQMRAKMMGERVPQKFMQNSIQPVILEKVLAIFKAQQMKALMVQ